METSSPRPDSQVHTAEQRRTVVIRQRMRRAEHEEGVVLIEFAFVFALFVFILYSLIAFGTALALKQSVTHAAAEGARAAVGVVDDPATAQDEREEKALTQVQE